MILMVCSCSRDRQHSPPRILGRTGRLRFPGGYLAIRGILGICFAVIGSLVPSLVHALLLRVCGHTSWWILGRRGRLVFAGGFFVVVAADALVPSLGGYFAAMA